MTSASKISTSGYPSLSYLCPPFCLSFFLSSCLTYFLSVCLTFLPFFPQFFFSISFLSFFSFFLFFILSFFLSNFLSLCLHHQGTLVADIFHTIGFYPYDPSLLKLFDNETMAKNVLVRKIFTITLSDFFSESKFFDVISDAFSIVIIDTIDFNFDR